MPRTLPLPCRKRHTIPPRRLFRQLQRQRATPDFRIDKTRHLIRATCKSACSRIDVWITATSACCNAGLARLTTRGRWQSIATYHSDSYQVPGLPKRQSWSLTCRKSFCLAPSVVKARPCFSFLRVMCPRISVIRCIGQWGALPRTAHATTLGHIKVGSENVTH